MMTINDLKLLYSGDRLGELLDLLDDLHTAASENTLQTFTTLSAADVVELLQDVVYTAQEAITEIEAQNKTHRQSQKGATAPTNILRLMPKDAAQETRHA